VDYNIDRFSFKYLILELRRDYSSTKQWKYKRWRGTEPRKKKT